MPKTSLFETQLRLVTDYVIEKGDTIDNNDYICPGDVFTMNYTFTRNYTSEDATVQVTVVSVRTVIDDDWPTNVYVLGCVLKTEAPIYICEWGAYLARGLTLHTETTTTTTTTTTVASGHVSRVSLN